MPSTRTRYARLLHSLFRQAPTQQPNVLSVGRADAARWGSARRLLTVSSSVGFVAAAWLENSVWHIARISLRDGAALMSPTRVVASDHDVVAALLREIEPVSAADAAVDVPAELPVVRPFADRAFARPLATV